jgi:hypothetical protein
MDERDSPTSSLRASSHENDSPHTPRYRTSDPSKINDCEPDDAWVESSRERHSDYGGTSARMLKQSSFPIRMSDSGLDIAGPTNLRSVNSEQMVSSLKARPPAIDKSRLRLDSRRIGGGMIKEHEEASPEKEESRCSLGGVLLSPESSRLHPGEPSHALPPHHQGHKLPKDRSSLVRSATLNRLVQVALAQVETNGADVSDAKAALMSIPLPPREFRAEKPFERAVEAGKQANSQPLPKTFDLSMPRPASSSPKRKTGLLNRGRALLLAADVSDNCEQIMSRRHGPSPPAIPTITTTSSKALPPLPQQSSSSNSHLESVSKSGLLSRGRQLDGALVMTEESPHSTALYAGIKMERDSGKMSEELQKLESNPFHSHRLQLPNISGSRTGRASEGVGYVLRGDDDFDW